MGIQHTCGSGQRCGNTECKNFVFCNIDTDGFCCDTIVTNGHDGASGSGIYQIHNYKQSDQQKNNTNGKVGIRRRTGNSLRSLDDHVTICFHIQGHNILHGEVKSCTVFSKINNIDQVLNDFTKCQGYDGQIISSQAKYRNTNQYTTDTCTDNSYQQCQKETHRRNRNRIHDTFGKYRAGKCAHTHKSRMTKA